MDIDGDETYVKDNVIYVITQWISVKDLLPNNKSRVLCCDIDKCMYVKIYEEFCNKGIFYGGDFFCYPPEYEIENVTHWMPLPPAPEY